MVVFGLKPDAGRETDPASSVLALGSEPPDDSGERHSSRTIGRELTPKSEGQLTPLTFTVEEAAKLLGIGRNSAYEAVRAKQIPSIRFGKRILVPREALLQMLGTAGKAAAL